ncbi:MAG: hypothetical protein K2K26_02465, partial [Muribaculaceae bacterium]|nr:hypothetical protein [Muribaculaceae bacterium]
MKKFLLPALVSTMLVGGASAEVNVTVTPLGERPVNTVRKVVSTADILVRQDFSDLTVPYESVLIGSLDFPDVENPNLRIDNPVTGSISTEFMCGQEGWSGKDVYSDKGAVVIQTYSGGAYYESYLRTPHNDYSGSLTISFIAKALPTRWNILNDDGEIKEVGYTGSSIQVGLYDSQDLPIEIVDGVSNSLADVRLYANQGWCE